MTLTVSVAEVAAYVLEVTGGRGVSLTGDGVTDEGGGRARLDAESWSDTQQRTVVLKDTAAVDTLSVALLDADEEQVAALGLRRSSTTRRCVTAFGSPACRTPWP